MKKISIIIPIYNTSEFLPECIHSVIKQTYQHLEILLINDGSNPECKEFIETFSRMDSRIKVLHLPERRGVGAARNLGIHNATGDYIYFLDSDDYIHHETLEQLINHIGDYQILSGRIKKITKREEMDNSDYVVKVLRNKNVARLFSNFSMLHRLISSDFIKQHQLKFAEDVDCYSDLAFITPAIVHLDSSPYLTNCFYYKRQRNDPITNPSLTQMERDVIVSDFLHVFDEMKTSYKESAAAIDFLDREYHNFYRKSIILLLADKVNIKKFFGPISNITKKVNPNGFNKLNFLVKWELQALRKNKQKRFEKLVQVHHTLRNLKKAISGKRKFYYALYRSLFMKLPLKEKTIVFESFLGKNYSDSPRNIYEYLIKQNAEFNYVWVFNEKKEIPGNAKQVKRFSLPYYYYMATSKYWVSNSRLPLNLEKRKGNVYLQTWHGTPLKKLVFDMNDVYSANPNYKKHFYKQSRRWDYLISANQYSSEIFKRAFKFDKEMLEFGYPRNDVLHQENKDEIAKNIKQRLEIPLEKKVILYAPTWRDDEFYEPGKYKFNLKLDLQKMKEKLGDEYVIVLRMHYFIADNIDTSGVEDFAYNFSKYNDIADLYLISDILITDYSSVFFDYANLKRPILFYTYDLEKYRDSLRGFYIDMETEVPGPLLKTTEEIIDSIENLDVLNETYKERYEKFYERICGWEKGNAAEKVAKKVFKL